MASESPRPRRQRYGYVRNALLILLGLLLVLAALLAWAIGTESGARKTFSAISSLSGNAIEARGIEGRLAGPLRVEQLSIARTNERIVLKDVRLDWQPRALLGKTLHVDSLHVGRVEVISRVDRQPEPDEPFPEDIGLPLAVQVDEVRMEGGNLRRGPVSLVEFGPLAFSFGFDGSRYLLELEKLAASPMLESGKVDARANGRLTLGARKPYPVDGHFSTRSEALVEQSDIGVAGELKLGGSLEELLADVGATINRARVKGHATLHPLSEQMLGVTQLTVRGLDLAALAPALPRTVLNIEFSASAEGAGELQLRNAAAGPYSEQKLPIANLEVAFAQQPKGFDFRRITATLGSAARPAGRISGEGSLVEGALNLTLNTDSLDLRRIDQRIRATRLAGQVNARHVDGRQEVTVSLSEPLNERRITLDAHAVLADEELAVERAVLKSGKGSIDASAQVALSGSQRFSAQGKISSFRLQDLGDFPQLPSLLLNGGFSLRGMRQPQLEADLSFDIVESELAGQPLLGKGRAQLRAEHLDVPEFQLHSGANRLDIRGRLSEDSSRLNFSVDAPQLAQFGKAFGGALQLQGSARGTPERPHIVASWNARDARLPSGLALESMQGKAEVALDRAQAFMLAGATGELAATDILQGDTKLAQLSAQFRFAPQATAPMELKLVAQDLSSGQLHANRIDINALGTTGRHTIKANIVEPAQSWSLQAGGGLDQFGKNTRWQGSIDTFDAKGALNAKLAGAAGLLLSQERVLLEDFVLDADGGQIKVEQFARDAGGIASQGRIERLQIAKLLRYAAEAPPLNTDLVLSGQWDMRLADTLSGKVRLQRDAGDITMLGNAPVTLGLGELQADLTAGNGKLDLQVQTAGTRLGNIDLKVATHIGNASSPLALADDAPLSGSARVDIPSLAWIAPLLSPSLIADGRLRVDMLASGTTGDPRLSGSINGDALQVSMTDLGVDLRQGTLRGDFQQDRLLLRELAFGSTEGKLTVSGPIEFGDGIDARLALRAERFSVLNRPDRRLVLSGASSIGWRENHAEVQGNFTVDSGFFDIGSANRPQLSDDVVIVGRDEAAEARKATAMLDVTVALGDGVTLNGRGLDAVLGGKLRLTAKPGETPQANGTLQIAKGSYSAYGRELNIEQGVLRFTGPLDNPALDILAMRRKQEVAAGVSVRGTVLAPRVTLVSDPVVPDAEKLSWLVLGRGLDTAGESDVASLQSAASALLSKGAVSGVQSRLASAFGLDTLSLVDSDDSLQERVVTLGKQISSRLYLGYQRGLESAGSVVQLRYQLSPKLSVEAETGARSALSLFYNIAFD